VSASLRSDRRRRLAAARLYLVAPARIRAGRLAELTPALARAGVDIVQLRDRSLSPEELERESRACADAAAAAGVLFVVNDDPALARAVGADGVHIGQDDGAVEDARALLGPDALIGRSSRGGAQLAAAAAEGADYCSVGPAWETPTKAGRPATGLVPIAAAARAARVPWFAIGGIDADRIGRIAALGARRVVVVRAIAEAPDPVAAARDLRARLTEGRARVMSVAGSDSGGGAGIQADVKAIAAAGGFPQTAIVALTAQSTVGVSGVHPVPPPFIEEQIATVWDDLGVDGLKTGMLGGPETVEAVAAALAPRLAGADRVPLVVDTVLRAESGAPLMAPGGEQALQRHLLPLATVITPNLIEARALAGMDSDDAAELARALHDRHGCAALVTGGHGPSADDVLADEGGVTRIPGVRLRRASTHGAGCTHSATLATLLARGEPLADAAAGAKAAATAAVRAGRPFGTGAGPVDVLAGRDEGGPR
jgi:hydroxymethylpyrimidine kinase/phosphomethylpyrimidine kinase/thiamine-phosphate diphosphorylase